jgi:LysM repeat protein
MNARRNVRLQWVTFLALFLALILVLTACERQLQGLLDNNANNQAAEEQEQEELGADPEVEGEAEMAPGLDAAPTDPNAGAEEPAEEAAGEEAPAGDGDQPVTGIPSDDPAGPAEGEAATGEEGETESGIPTDDPAAPTEGEAAATGESPRPADAATPEAGVTGEAGQATPTTGEAAAEEMAQEAEAAAQEATAQAMAQTTPEATAETPEATAETPESTADATVAATAEATPAATEAAAEEAAGAEQTVTAAGERIHVVQPGENLYRIGLQYGVSWVVLAQLNNLPNANALVVGQQLRIPGDPNTGGTPTPTPAPSAETTYVVQPGDTLARIASSFNVTWQQIAQLNGLVNPNRIFVGQVLKIPGATPAPLLTHTVQPRETLFVISLRYGVPWMTIASANNLSAPYVIYPGQTLTIPGQ